MTDDKDRAGLGKVIYSVDDDADAKRVPEDRDERAEVVEADKESFPASDPPGYAGRSTAESE